MRIIDLDAVPNQSFSVTLNGDRWDFVIKQAKECMFADVTLNDTVILSGQRLVAGTPVIPYEHLQGRGNFIILTENDELPDWQRFGMDQIMVYATAEEIAQAVAS